LIQVFAFASGKESEAHAEAKEFDEEAARRGVTTLEVAIRRGQVLQFRLTLHGLDLWDQVRRLTWNGRTTSVQYEVTIPPDRPAGNLLGTVFVTKDGVPVGRIGFKLTVVARRTQAGNELVSAGEEAAAFRKAFAAYDSEDRSKVLARIQMLRPPLSRIEVFHDTLSLTPGDCREREIYRRIDDCDLFLLFWSRKARESEWVRRELQYAIRRQGPNGEPPPTILPVLIEGPPPPLPPEELAHLHFDDHLLYLMGEESPAPDKKETPAVHKRLHELQARLPSLAEDLGELGNLEGISITGAMNKTRIITEKVLHRLCTCKNVSWGQAEPTLERMIGPLVSSGCIPKNVAIHVRTIQGYSSPGSHYQESALTGRHLDIAVQALIEFLDWVPETD
jgi:hypothetical protein